MQGRREQVFLGLGSNLGDRLRNLQAALERLTQRGVPLRRSSNFYQTAPWGRENQEWFLNAVVEVDPVFSPHQLLKVALAVEGDLGRVRAERWGPRTLDVDILLYGLRRVQEPDLVLPHPRLEERAFVLAPLAELEPDMVLPSGRGIREVLRETLAVGQKVLPWSPI